MASWKKIALASEIAQSVSTQSLDVSGSVSIGTTNSSKKLNIFNGSDGVISNFYGANADGVRLSTYVNDSSGYALIYAYDDNDGGVSDFTKLYIGSNSSGKEIVADGQGRLGIGTTSLSRKFTVVNTTTNTATGYFYTNAVHTGVDTHSVVSIRSDNASSTGNVLHVQGDGTGNLLTLSKDGSDKLTVTHEGKVGIGISSVNGVFTAYGTPMTAISAQTVADIFGDAQQDADKGGGIGLGGRYITNSGSVTAFAEISGVKANNTSANYEGEMVFKTRVNGGNLTERMRIDGSGNVTVNSGSAIQFGDSSYKIIGSTIGNYLRFYTESTQALEIDDNQDATFAGKVAISSAFTNNELLGVKGSVGSDWGARIENTSSIGAGALIKSATTNAGVQLFQVRSVSDNVFTIMGDQKATFSSNVGIGRTPTQKLDIYASSGNQTIMNELGGSGNAELRLKNNAGDRIIRASSDKLQFIDNADSRADLSIDGSGNSTFAGDVQTGGTVNIIGASSATATLNINANNGASVNNKVRFLKEIGAEFKLQMNTGGVSSFANLVNFTGTGTTFHNNVTIASGGSTDNLYLANTSYGMRITNSTGVIDFISNGSTRMSIANGGGVTFTGNTTSNGNILAQGSAAPSISVLDTTNNASLQMRALDTEVRFGSTSNHPVKIGTNNSYDVLVLGTDKSATFGGDITVSSATDTKPILKLEQTGNNVNGGQFIFLTSGTANDNDLSGVIRFKGMNDAGTPEEIEYATIYAKNTDVSDGSEDGELHFRTMSAGSLDSRLTLRSSNATFSGDVIVSKSTAGGKSNLHVKAIKTLDSTAYLLGGIESSFSSSAWLSANTTLLGPALTGYGTGVAYLTFSTDGTNKLSTFAGNLGINTDSGGWGLNVKGVDANVFKVLASDGNTLSYLQGTNGDATQRWFADGNDTKVLINTNGDSYFTGGNVGIGTATPTHNLNVYNGSGGSSMTVGKYASGKTVGVLATSADTSGYFQIQSYASQGTTFGILSLNRAGGNVNIGTSGDYAKLTVGGTGDIVALRASSGTAGFTMYEAGTGRFNMTTLNGSGGIAFKVPTTTALTLDSSQTATFTGNIKPSSDSTISLGTDSVRFLDIYTDGLDLRGDVYSILNLNSAHTYSLNRNWRITTNNFGSGSWGGISIDQSTAVGGTSFVQKFGIDINGNVGIGTVAPTGLLSFPAADSATPKIRFLTTAATNLADAALSTTDDSGGTELLIGSNISLNASGAVTRFTTGRSGSGIQFGYTGRIKFFTETGTTVPSEKMRLDDNGRLGIGTTSPSTMLHLKSSTSTKPKITIEDTNEDDNMGALQFIKDSASPNTGDKLMQIWAYGDNDFAEQILYSEIATLPTSVADGSEEGSMRFRVMNAGSFGETMRIRGDKVGIGTTSPAVQFHVKSSTANNFRIERSGTTNAAIHFKNASEDWYAGITSAENFSISRNADIAAGTDFVIRGNTGRVGIGTSNPDTNLHIYKASAGALATTNTNSQFTIENSSHASMQFLSPNSANSIIYFGDAEDNDVGYINYVHSSNTMNFQTNTAVRLSIEDSGNVNIGSSSKTNNVGSSARGLTIGNATAPVLSLWDTTNAGYHSHFFQVENNAFLRSSGNLTIQTNAGTVALTVDSNQITNITPSSNTGVSFDNASNNIEQYFRANSVDSIAKIKVSESAGGGVIGLWSKNTSGTQVERLNIDTSGYATFSGSINTQDITAYNMITIESADISSGENNGLRLINTSGTDHYWHITNGQTGVSNENFTIRDGTNNRDVLVLTSAGNATFSGNIEGVYIETFSHNFTDDLGTSNVYIPWQGTGENTGMDVATTAFLTPFAMELVSFRIRPETISNSGTINVQFYKQANGSTTRTDIGMANTGTLSTNNVSILLASAFDILPTVSANEKVGFKFLASTDLGGEIDWYVTTVWKVTKLI